MGIFSKILTAIRGGAREVGESIVDANSIRIFEQEIKEAEDHLEKAKRDLTEVVAKEMQASRALDQIAKDVEKHESYAREALSKNNETLALEIAQKIATLESEKAIQTKAKESFSKHANRLKDMIKKTKLSVADLKRQLVMVKTTDSVQKATTAITSNYASSGSKLLSAKESLDRIQSRQQDLEDRLEAGEQLADEFDGGNLEDKLREAGIGDQSSSANDILARLKSSS